MPKLNISSRQQRELAGIACFALAALTALAVYLPTAGSAMLLLRQHLTGLFGLGVLFVIGIALAAGIELLAPWIETITPARGLGLVLLLASSLGLLHLSTRDAGAFGRSEAEALTSLVGTAGSILLLGAVLVGGLVLAFDISLREAVGALHEQYLDSRLPEPPEREHVTSRATRRPEKGPRPEREVIHHEPEEPVLVPIQGVAAPGHRETASLAPRTSVLTEEEELPEPPIRHMRSAAPERLPISQATAEDDEPRRDWRKPGLQMLDTVTVRKERLHDEIKANIKLIEQTLLSFDVEATVIGVNSGPSVTQYELQPAKGVAVRKITALQNDLALVLSAPIRIQAPIPGKPAVGIEVPNKATSLVTLREIIQTPAFQNDQTLLSLAIGTDVSGNSVVGDLTKMPHLLIAGATGSGKSVCINALLAGLMFQATPDELKLILIDPKRVEFALFVDLPHLMVPVVTESEQAVASLRWAVAEMENRYKLFASHTVRNIGDFNSKAPEMGLQPLPYIVVIIDELADLMMVAAGEIEELICRVAQLARAVGIHLLVATQRPSADIITGLIKANIPSRIAFAVSSMVDSRVILDEPGAEKLLGRGDML